MVGFATVQVGVERDRTSLFRMVHIAKPGRAVRSCGKPAANVHRRPKKRSGRVLDTRQTL